MESLNKKIVVVGNGLAGWISSYMLSATFSRLGVRVIYAESAKKEYKTGKICSLDNFSEIFPILNLLRLDIKSFFNQCSAQVYVGYQYVDVARDVDFIQTFSGYDGSNRSKINEDLIPLLAKIFPSANYQDFSLTAQLALQNRFYSDEKIQENPKLLHGVGVNFVEESFVDILRSRREDSFFDYQTYSSLSVENGGSGVRVRLDSVLLDADLFVDATGSSAEIISLLAKKKNLECLSGVTSQLNGSPLAKRLVRCSYAHNSFSLTKHVAGFSECTVFDSSMGLLEKDSAFVYETPWISNVVAIGNSSGNFSRVVHGELDIVINQIKSFIEVFPAKENSFARQQYYNSAAYQKILWLYRFNWMVIHFSTIVVSGAKSPEALGSLAAIRERMMIFAKTSFVFTEDGEIFSDFYWKQFFVGSKYPYLGGVPYLMGRAESVMDLLKEKMLVHQEINQLENLGYLS